MRCRVDGERSAPLPSRSLKRNLRRSPPSMAWARRSWTPFGARAGAGTQRALTSAVSGRYICAAVGSGYADVSGAVRASASRRRRPSTRRPRTRPDLAEQQHAAASQAGGPVRGGRRASAGRGVGGWRVAAQSGVAVGPQQLRQRVAALRSGARSVGSGCQRGELRNSLREPASVAPSASAAPSASPPTRAATAFERPQDRTSRGAADLHAGRPDRGF